MESKLGLLVWRRPPLITGQRASLQELSTLKINHLAPGNNPFPLQFLIVDTSGHVPGHVSLVVYSDEVKAGHGVTSYLPGDAT